MSSSDPFSDFEQLRTLVRRNTVDRLKAVITSLAQECGASIGKYGKKQDLIDRIVSTLSAWRASGDVDKINKARAILHQVHATGSYNPSTSTTYASAPAVNHAMKNPSQRYPYIPPAPTSRPALALPHTAAASASTSSAVHRPVYRPKPSPFFTNEVAVSNVVECPESTSPQDRRQQSLTFSLHADHIAKLRSTSEQWQLRLYCTSSSFYGLGAAAYRFMNQPCPIEFPPTCEIRVNNTQLNASTKGIKKKPGTAPPPNLGKAVVMTPGASNRVDLVYVNSNSNNQHTPPPPKKYYMLVMLVRHTSTEQLIERLKREKYVSRAQVCQERRAKMAQDEEDIVAGPSKISLKCPLSYGRITTPCRSSQCVHPSCFDALSWYSVNEQTTTWSCPICEKSIMHDELIVDGYFDEILKATSEDTEDVMVEADGEWHTSDGEHASAGWRVAHTPASLPTSATASVSQSHDGSSTTSSATAVNVTVAERSKDLAEGEGDVEVLILDSDDEDEGQVKRQLSATAALSSSSIGSSYPPESQSTVIDLTLSDDDEPPSVLGKRRGLPGSGSENAGKRPRPDDMLTGKVAVSFPAGHGSDRGASPYMNGNLHSPQRPSDPAFLLPPPTSSLSPPSHLAFGRYVSPNRDSSPVSGHPSPRAFASVHRAWEGWR